VRRIPVCGGVGFSYKTNTKRPINSTYYPPTSGLFRLTYYLESSKVPGSDWFIGFNWTDEVKARLTGKFEATQGNTSGQSLA
jgi:hypothetical protein